MLITAEQCFQLNKIKNFFIHPLPQYKITKLIFWKNNMIKALNNTTIYHSNHNHQYILFALAKKVVFFLFFLNSV